MDRMTGRALLRLSLPLLATSALAQPVVIPPGADPGVIQQREIEREQRMRAEELRRDRIERPVGPVAPPAAAAPSAADNVQFTVREFRFEPASELLPAATLEALVAPYRGRSVRLGELRELVAKINAAYRERGVVTAQANLPPQDVTDGIVRIRLVEGRVGQVRLQGNASTRDDYITDRLTLKPKDLVDLPTLEHDLLRFNRGHDAQLRADLVPGRNPGETDIGLAVTEPKRDDLRLFADTAGSPATGITRSGVAYLRRSLTGRRDDLYLSASKSEGHEGYVVTYGLSLGTAGTRATVGYFKDRTRIVNGPIEPLDVTGAAESFTLQLRHPLVVNTRTQLDLTGSLKKRRSSNWIVGTPLISSALTGGSVGFDAQLLDEAGHWVITGDFVGGTERVEAVGSRNYQLLRGSVRRSYSFNPRLTFTGALTGQYAERRQLPSSEQFVIGGEGSVRGHAPGVFAGDRGYAVNLELQRRIELPQPSPWALGVFGFVDHGYVDPYRPPGNLRGADVLSSVGAGMSFAYGSRVTARFAFGVPVNRPDEEPRKYRVHAQLVWFLL